MTERVETTEGVVEMTGEWVQMEGGWVEMAEISPCGGNERSPPQGPNDKGVIE